ncbi:MAG: hypothetical protein JSV83_13390 [Desulfobacterales bacterium]|nr:MAG: hypothetical protein JSV83_13390 [Desulfobacterales bacterium]
MGKVFRFILQVIGKKQLIRDIKLRFTMRIVSNIIVGSLIWGYVRMDAGFYLLVRA